MPIINLHSEDFELLGWALEVAIRHERAAVSAAKALDAPPRSIGTAATITLRKERIRKMRKLVDELPTIDDASYMLYQKRDDRPRGAG